MNRGTKERMLVAIGTAVRQSSARLGCGLLGGTGAQFRHFLSFAWLVLMALGVLQVGAVQAQQVSQAQIEQFKNLPRAQQEALARQYGIDLSMLERQGSSQGSGQGSISTEDAESSVKKRSEGTSKLWDEALGDAEESGKLPVFGANLFSGQPSTFAPVNNAPVPGNYRISAGDTVKIQYFGQENATYTVEVDREGFLNIPKLGPISVAGLRYEKMKELLNEQIEKRLIGIKAAISMGELRSMQIFVLGEAYQPGAYTVSSLTTMSQALFASGGLSELASLRNIKLMRSGEVVTEFDLYDLLVYGDASKDRLMQAGDALFIPPRGALVKLTGEVSRPAYYEIKKGESLEKLIEFAGGFLPTAYKRSVSLKRSEQGQLHNRTLDGTVRQTLAYQMAHGDEIYVPKVSDSVDNSVHFLGAVERAGAYEWKPGARIQDFIKSATQDLKPDADFSYGLVIREEEQRKIRVLQFDVSSMLAGDLAHNYELKPLDQVLFFSRFELEYERALAGFGAYANNPEKVLEKEREKRSVLRLRAEEMGDLLNDNGRKSQSSDVRLPVSSSRQQLLRTVLTRLQSQGSKDAGALFVSVTGEVRFPGVYPLVEHATVADLVAAAGGLKESAYLARAEVTRTEVVGEVAQTDYFTFNLLDAITGQEQVEIISRDRLNIFKIPDWQDVLEVKVAGEVRFPGTYAIRNGETLSDLIRRAGGLTELGHASGAVFTRSSIKKQEQERVNSLVKSLRQEMASMSLTEGSNVASYEQVNMLLQDLIDVQPIGRLVLNLDEALKGNKDLDIQLEEGDALYIPTMNKTVSIVGEVHMPTTYRYNPGLSIQEYIARSGGTKRRADTKRMFVVRSSGEVVPYSPRRGWFTSSERVVLEPGDTIVVPLDTTYKDNMQLWATSTQIIYQLAVAAAAISRI